MTATTETVQPQSIWPLTAARWPDLERLFGPHGAAGGCWCMWWRLPRQQWQEQRGEGNRLAFQAIVDAGEEPGLLAYVGDEPAGWCAVAPRTSYPSMERAPALRSVDAQPVWSISCFFVARQFRRQGLSLALLREAVAFAGRSGAKIVEGYPREASRGRLADGSLWTGLPSVFRRAGFVEVTRRSPSRPIMRCLP
jgi:GNAT superfamily N-acetyltransferase